MRSSDSWLADVGFGDCFLEPLSLTRPTESEQMGKTYRLLEDGDGLLLQRKSPEKDWAPQYQFIRTPHQLEEFAPMCHFHQTSPESSFTQRRLCSMATAEDALRWKECVLLRHKMERRQKLKLPRRRIPASATREVWSRVGLSVHPAKQLPPASKSHQVFSLNKDARTFVGDILLRCYRNL